MSYRGEVIRSLPLSRIQHLIWLGQKAQPDLPVYNAAYSFHFKKPLDVSAFSIAHQLLIESTDTFKIAFRLEAGELSQCLLGKPLGELERIESDSTEPADRNDAISEIAKTPLDLANSPWRSVLTQYRDGTSIWTLLQSHLLTDGVSVHIIYRRLAELYERVSQGVLEEPKEQAPQFSQWVERSVDSPRSTSTRSKFQETQAERSKLFSSQAPTGSPFGIRTTQSVPDALLQSVRSLAEKPDFASFSRELSECLLLLTSYAALLSRIQFRETFSIGFAVHGRSTQEERQIAGPFVSMLSIRLYVSQSDSFHSLYDKVAEAYFEAMGAVSQGTPSQDSQQEFDVTFSYLTGGFSDFAGQKPDASWVYPGCHENANRWRIHFMSNAAGSIDLISDTNNEAFPGDAAKTAIDCLLRTIDAFASDPEGPVFGFDLVVLSEDTASMLSTLEQPFSGYSTLWEAFEETATTNKSKLAVKSDAGELTYAELLTSAKSRSKVTSRLDKPESPLVPIIGKRGIKMLEAILSVLSSGNAFLPVDSELPKHRIDQLIEDSEARSLIDTTIDWPTTIYESPRSDPKSEIAYAIYTSGSTDAPNGVLVGHQSVLNLLTDMQSRAPLPANSNAMWWTSVGFDVSIYEIFSAILFGHSLKIPSEEIRLNPNKLFAWMKSEEIHSAYLPPFLLNQFNDWLGDAVDFPLRRLLVGVEPIQERLLASISQKVPGLKIINGYGPTEATVCATFHDVDASCSVDKRTPIGKPVSGNRCYVVDSHLNLMPRGTTGELCIAGRGLSLGYWRRPEVQRARFVNDPFHKGAETERMYKTGDLVRMTDERELEFVGRVDHQIKLRGNRIEPAEIEQVFLALPEIDRCKALVMDVRAREEIVCYYVAKSPVGPERLHTHGIERLPQQLVPRHFCQIESFPLTLNGKIDTDKLPPPEVHPEHDFVNPEGPIEERVSEFWQDALGLKKVSAESSFFDLGGSSLIAMETVIAISREFEIDLPLSSIFRYNNVRRLSRVVETRILDAIEKMSEEEAENQLTERSEP